MENHLSGTYDVIVVGAGHAGCEAGLAGARMGLSTLMLTINLDAIAMMPCNPSIGGTGKGHLVKEIDALGGEMGINADKAMIQCKMLNTAKGPAVHSLRAQADKQRYHSEMKQTLERTPNLWIRQAEVTRLGVENGRVTGVYTRTGGFFKARAVVVAAGTYLKGRIFIGHTSYPSGPNGLAPSQDLSEDLRGLGLSLRRFKTGTPARINSRSMDTARMVEQPGDSEVVPFSFMNDSLAVEQVSCWLTYTNEATHRVIRDNIHLSAMYSGQIEGTGPRYCPSIEDKISRFADKERHQLFLEPEGRDTREVYVQGMSTSLPEPVQLAFMQTIEGLEQVEIMRPAYAIEYDCVDPMQLTHSLEHKAIEGLFCAGQFNGTSGYEEAAAQGLVAGINAALKVQGKDPFTLNRSEAYIGVLIDDLVTKGTGEPYRIMTSRCEYRLILRQDNADMRLTEKGWQVGLVTEARYRRFQEKCSTLEAERQRLKGTKLRAEQVNPILEGLGKSLIRESMSLEELLKRPELDYRLLAPVDAERPPLSREVTLLLETEIKYAGYIRKQMAEIQRFEGLERMKIPVSTDYDAIGNLRTEARQKLKQVRPESVGQASRISGVSPADISVLMVALEQQRRKAGQNG